MKNKFTTAALVLLFVAFVAALRLWGLEKFPGAEWDESVYQCMGQDWLHNGTVLFKDDLELRAQAANSGGYWYHPPFYFKSLGEWFRMVGSESLAVARGYSGLSNVLMLLLLVFFARELLGTWKKAVLASLLIATDAWLILSARTAWFENQMMLIGVIGLMLWHYAGKEVNENRKTALYVMSGITVGAAVVFKQVGFVFLMALAIHWAFDLKKDSKQRFLCLAIVFLCLEAYVMYAWNAGGNNFLANTLHQYLRTTGATADKAVNISVSQSLGIIAASAYVIFIPSMILLGFAGLVLLKDIFSVVKGKKVTVVAAWAIAALIFFAAIKLHNPHYALMYITPLGYYLGMKLVQKWKHATLLIGLYVFVSLMTLGFRMTVPDHALNEAHDYISQHITASEVVVTEESVACGIPQQYLGIRLRKNREFDQLAKYNVHYVITVQSRTYQPVMEDDFKALVNGGRVVASFSDYKWTISVFKIR